MEKLVALPIKSTRNEEAKSYVNAIIYGQSGIGKTVLCSTAPKPLILSAEDGLLSLAGKDVDYVKINSLDAAIAAYNEIRKSENCLGYQSICIDSLSELAESILTDFKKEERDPRKAYGRMSDEINALVKKFKKLPLNVFFIAKIRVYVDEFAGKQSYGPGFPGKQLQDRLPYEVDLVLPLRLGKHKGEDYRFLQTAPDIQYEAKDRSGKLSGKEQPDLTVLLEKIQGKKVDSNESKETKEEENVNDITG